MKKLTLSQKFAISVTLCIIDFILSIAIIIVVVSFVINNYKEFRPMKLSDDQVWYAEDVITKLCNEGISTLNVKSVDISREGIYLSELINNGLLSLNREVLMDKQILQIELQKSCVTVESGIVMLKFLDDKTNFNMIKTDLRYDNYDNIVFKEIKPNWVLHYIFSLLIIVTGALIFWYYIILLPFSIFIGFVIDTELPY